MIHTRCDEWRRIIKHLVRCNRAIGAFPLARALPLDKQPDDGSDFALCPSRCLVARTDSFFCTFRSEAPEFTSTSVFNYPKIVSNKIIALNVPSIFCSPLFLTSIEKGNYRLAARRKSPLGMLYASQPSDVEGMRRIFGFLLVFHFVRSTLPKRINECYFRNWPIHATEPAGHCVRPCMLYAASEYHESIRVSYVPMNGAQ